MERSAKWKFGPDDVRRIRGARSREEFAQLAAVTPLTVYRWELPDGAEQARRPRGKVAARLAEIAALAEGAMAARAEPARPAADAPMPAPEPALDAAEQTTLLPLLERLSAGDLRVEGALLALMASGRLGTRAGRALAAQALARVLLLARGDVCGAVATVGPLLPELATLPGAVELELQATAALIFSWPDGRFFDPGKVNAHLAGAERLLPRLGTPETRFLLGLARASVALVLADPEMMAAVVPQVVALGSAVTSPAYRTLLREAEAIAALAAGRVAFAAQALEEIGERGAIAISRVRALAFLATLAIQDARPPRDALALVERAREIARQARMPLGGHPGMVLATVEGRALTRLARFADAVRVFGEAIEFGADVRWSPVYPALGLAHVHVCTGSPDALRELGERLTVLDSVVGAGLTRDVGALLIASASLLVGRVDDVGAVDRLDRHAEELAREVPWQEVRGDLLLTAAMLAANAGTPEQAQRALRRAERHFERFPSIWGTAVLRRSHGVLLARQGQLQRARELVESAVGTLTLAEDLGGAVHARLVLAQLDGALGDPEAAPRVTLLRAELERLGFDLGPRGYLHGATDHLAPHGRAPGGEDPPRPAGALQHLVVPVQRLGVRGMSRTLLQRELVTVASEQTGGAAVFLHELDSTGRTTLLQHAGPEGVAVSEWVELSDGAGRRLRLGAGGPGVGAETRALLTILASVAELALELAALRSVGAQPPAAGTMLREGEGPEVPGFVSVSDPMRQLKADLVRLSRSRSTIIISGESGSGKEVVARAIHDLSTRARKPYVAFNCAAVPRDLFEGQLFGYRKGAFTGATTDHPGVLRSADGGTVLLDEIGELPLEVQPKLLRFLENGEILPLGERKPVMLDVRVIAATFRDLAELVREHRFREDLYYRLQVVPLHVPPLRERPDDVVALARHFIRQLTPAGGEPPVLAPDALAVLHGHRWPGNVRELRNVVERALAFEPLPPVLGAEHLRIAV